jgi:NAD(P)-dependent dehydrogenase (short-subunit alcohol dehydrogenase family)
MTTVQVLSGRTAIITGASRGLGLEIARHFVAAGADVALCARDGPALQEEAQKLASQFSDRRVAWRSVDVQSESDTRLFVEWAIGELGHVDALVNNAGIYGPLGDFETTPWDKWVEAINVNLMGSALMARAVLKHMKSRRRGAIVQISGGGATNPLPGISAYAASKAGIVRFAESLALEVKPYGITVNAIAPGALNTRLLDEVLDAGPEKVGQKFYEQSLEQRRKGGVPLSKGAELAVFLASGAAQGITGRLISALWDRWDAWPDHLIELESSDLYTLRRITGRDRGQSWGDV